MDLLLEADGLSVEFVDKRVLDSISLKLRPGARLGLVGESGSGKSTLGLAILGLLPDTARLEGAVRFEGALLPWHSEKAMTAIRGAKIGFVHQDPMSAFSPIHTIGTHLVRAIRAAQPGISHAKAEARAVDMLDEVEITRARERLGHYPSEYSGGMLQRVMIAASLAGDPALLIADEPTTALDVTTQATVLSMLRRLTEARGMSFILISHDLGVVADVCHEVAVMYGGRLIQHITIADLSERAHPYTRALLAARPSFGKRGKPLSTIADFLPKDWFEHA